MRLTIRLLGCEVLAISTDPPEQSPPDRDEHDHLAAQVELPCEPRMGFHIEPVPSVTERET